MEGEPSEIVAHKEVPRLPRRKVQSMISSCCYHGAFICSPPPANPVGSDMMEQLQSKDFKLLQLSNTEAVVLCRQRYPQHNSLLERDDLRIRRW